MLNDPAAFSAKAMFFILVLNIVINLIQKIVAICVIFDLRHIFSFSLSSICLSTRLEPVPILPGAGALSLPFEMSLTREFESHQELERRASLFTIVVLVKFDLRRMNSFSFSNIC